MTWPAPLDAALYLAAGSAAGALHFVLLARAVRRLLAPGGGRGAAPLHLARFAATGAVFWLVAQAGAAPLALALAGFVLARTAAQRLWRAG